jgi:hypothetical protein
MSTPEEDQLGKQGRIYIKAKNIIAQVMKEACPKDVSQQIHDKNAQAVIARLAAADILLCHPDEMKDE